MTQPFTATFMEILWVEEESSDGNGGFCIIKCKYKTDFPNCFWFLIFLENFFRIRLDSPLKSMMFGNSL